MKDSSHITILGGGPAGLAIGFYARKAAIPFTIYEASDYIGGNARTLEYDGFLFDIGAHRFHDKYPDVTTEVKELLKEDLRQVYAPSQIFYKGKFLDFPISPLNVLKKLGIGIFLRGCFEILSATSKSGKSVEHFGDFATRTYGRKIAKIFVLDYSEKLWGRSSHRLSPKISGKRLQRFTFKTFLEEIIQNGKAQTKHRDGTFYYPVKGIGMIADSLSQFCGENNIRRNTKVSRIFHDRNRVIGIEINGEEQIKVDEIANTLPMPLFLSLMEPKPEEKILSLAQSLQFRSLILVAVFLNKTSVTKNAAVYFPSDHFIFNRIYEPKNRSAFMAPEGKTSLIAEIACSVGDDRWALTNEALAENVCAQLTHIGWTKKNEIINTLVKRFPYAYPILEIGFEEKISEILNYLKQFDNLKLSGRSGEFKYTHIHDLLKSGKDVIEEAKKRNTFKGVVLDLEFGTF
jgi:protoporphyrinogen oxidase